MRPKESIEDQIKEMVAQLLMMDPNVIDTHESLETFGFDSIMAVQLQNEIELNFQSQFDVHELVGMTLHEIVDSVSKPKATPPSP